MKTSLKWFGLLGLVCVLSRPVLAETGVGVILGEPTGITAKFWQDKTHAIDAGLAFSFNDFLLVYGDYLIHFPNGFGSSTEFLKNLTPYVGAGAELLISSTSSRRGAKYYESSGAGLGFRIPLGAEWRDPKIPVGFFAEIVPGVGILPSTFGFVQGGVGARYYF